MYEKASYTFDFWTFCDKKLFLKQRKERNTEQEWCTELTMNHHWFSTVDFSNTMSHSCRITSEHFCKSRDLVQNDGCVLFGEDEGGSKAHSDVTTRSDVNTYSEYSRQAYIYWHRNYPDFLDFQGIGHASKYLAYRKHKMYHDREDSESTRDELHSVLQDQPARNHLK